jgi:hypothetical protein
MATRRDNVSYTPYGSNLTIPDVRDGLTQLERTILYVLYRCREEYGDRHIPTALVFGRVVELIDCSTDQFTLALASAQQKESARRR